MENILLDALKISGIGIFALLLILALLAGVVSLMTKHIKDKPEEDTVEEAAPQLQAASKTGKKSNLGLVAAIAVAIAKAQSEMTMAGDGTQPGEVNAWRQFQLHRRLTQSSTIRRAK
ncbi:MAG: OadG family protein [Anaerolineaceae bacterium]|nr:OadG family protein [Anaerolineaceae bacterium]MBN2676507.1 OadG family protein [Anaerolineaceae bacterium]